MNFKYYLRNQVSVEKPVLPEEGNDSISPEHEVIGDLQVVLSGATMPLGIKKYLDELLDVRIYSIFLHGVGFASENKRKFESSSI